MPLVVVFRLWSTQGKTRKKPTTTAEMKTLFPLKDLNS
jgi:hypothetical protein